MLKKNYLQVHGYLIATFSISAHMDQTFGTSANSLQSISCNSYLYIDLRETVITYFHK